MQSFNSALPKTATLSFLGQTPCTDSLLLTKLYETSSSRDGNASGSRAPGLSRALLPKLAREGDVRASPRLGYAPGGRGDPGLRVVRRGSPLIFKDLVQTGHPGCTRRKHLRPTRGEPWGAGTGGRSPGTGGGPPRAPVGEAVAAAAAGSAARRAGRGL